MLADLLILALIAAGVALIACLFYRERIRWPDENADPASDKRRPHPR